MLSVKPKRTIMKRILASAIIAISALLAGCHHLTDEDVTANPTLNTSRSDIGRGNTIAVKVFNGVDSQQIGIRSSLYEPGYAINLTNDLTPIVNRAVISTLQANDFKPVSQDASRHLTVRLNSLKYQYSNPGSLRSTITISCSITVEANAERDRLKRTYQSKLSYRILTTPTIQSDQNRINAVLAAALNQMINDAELMHLLSQ